MIVDAGCDCAPTDAALQRFDELKKQADDLVGKWADLQRTDVAAFQRLAADHGILPVAIPASGSPISAGQDEP
jgi:hypothetical protein